jgi:hypothetical protein
MITQREDAAVSGQFAMAASGQNLLSAPQPYTTGIGGAAPNSSAIVR